MLREESCRLVVDERRSVWDDYDLLLDPFSLNTWNRSVFVFL